MKKYIHILVIACVLIATMSSCQKDEMTDAQKIEQFVGNFAGTYNAASINEYATILNIAFASTGNFSYALTINADGEAIVINKTGKWEYNLNAQNVVMTISDGETDYTQIVQIAPDYSTITIDGQTLNRVKY